MGNYIVCDGEIIFPPNVAGPGSAGYLVDGITTYPPMPVCKTGWLIKPEPATDFQGLIDLLQFDPETCGLLIGICVLFFVIGHAAGHVARNLGRV